MNFNTSFLKLEIWTLIWNWFYHSMIFKLLNTYIVCFQCCLIQCSLLELSIKPLNGYFPLIGNINSNHGFEFRLNQCLNQLIQKDYYFFFPNEFLSQTNYLNRTPLRMIVNWFLLIRNVHIADKKFSHSLR